MSPRDGGCCDRVHAFPISPPACFSAPGVSMSSSPVRHCGVCARDHRRWRSLRSRPRAPSGRERNIRGNRWVLRPLGDRRGRGPICPPTPTDRFLDARRDSLRWFVRRALCAQAAFFPSGTVFVLGRRFSGLAAIQSGPSLVTRGIYGVIRPPTISAALMFMLGGALVSAQHRHTAGGPILVPVLARIASEENLPASSFPARIRCLSRAHLASYASFTR